MPWPGLFIGSVSCAVLALQVGRNPATVADLEALRLRPCPDVGAVLPVRRSPAPVAVGRRTFLACGTYLPATLPRACRPCRTSQFPGPGLEADRVTLSILRASANITRNRYSDLLAIPHPLVLIFIALPEDTRAVAFSRLSAQSGGRSTGFAGFRRPTLEPR